MKKFSVILLILFLILFTAFIKNSTKRLDDEIFSIKENIRVFEKDFDKLKLEHNYLSSADKLLDFQILYFENELVKKDIQKIRIIHKNENELIIKKLKFIDEK